MSTENIIFAPHSWLQWRCEPVNMLVLAFSSNCRCVGITQPLHCTFKKFASLKSQETNCLKNTEPWIWHGWVFLNTRVRLTISHLWLTVSRARQIVSHTRELVSKMQWHSGSNDWMKWTLWCYLNNDGTLGWTSAVYFNNLHCNIVLSSSVVSCIVAILLHSDLFTLTITWLIQERPLVV